MLYCTGKGDNRPDIDITFPNDRLRRLCESGRELQRAFGAATANKVMARLLDLRAAPSLDDMRHLPGHCHELEGDRKGQLGVDVGNGRRIVLEIGHNPMPRKPDGGLDWNAVHAVVV